jgi:hypothetical protein
MQGTKRFATETVPETSTFGREDKDTRRTHFFLPILALAMFWFNDLNCADMVPNVLTGMWVQSPWYNFHEMCGLMFSHEMDFCLMILQV